MEITSAPLERRRAPSAEDDRLEARPSRDSDGAHVVQATPAPPRCSRALPSVRRVGSYRARKRRAVSRAHVHRIRTRKRRARRARLRVMAKAMRFDALRAGLALSVLGSAFG